MSKNIRLVSESQIKSASIIEKNVDSTLLAKTIQTVQEIELKEILGSGLYNSVLAAVYDSVTPVAAPTGTTVTGTTTTPINPVYKELLNGYIIPFLVHQVVVEFITVNNYKLTNKGVLKMRDDIAETSSGQELKDVRDYYNNIAAKYKQNLIKFLEANELSEPGTDRDQTSDTIGWFLGDTYLPTGDATIVVNNGVTVTGSTGNVVGVKGDKGDKGDQGEQGPQGLSGPKGDKGDRGLQGLQGIQGVPGPQGLQGLTGPKGDKGEPGVQGIPGATGPQGLTGPKGDKGDVGAQGLMGPKGDKGDTGAAGLKGDTGAQGIQGLTGQQGLKGDIGAQGPKGDSGVPGAQGPKGDTGVPGAQGPKGDTGEQGIQGVAGPKGDQGIQGIQGIPGAVGAAGAQGLKGDKGDKGDTGATGAAGSSPFSTVAAGVAYNGKVFVGSTGSVDSGEALQVTGSAKVSALAGTGERMVTADANGQLSTQTIPTGGGSSIGATQGNFVIKTGGDYWQFPNAVGNKITSGFAFSSGSLYLVPYVLYRRSLVGKMGINITTGSSSYLRFVIYGSNDHGMPMGKKFDGSVDSSSQTGIITVTANVTLEAGLYWIGVGSSYATFTANYYTNAPYQLPIPLVANWSAYCTQYQYTNPVGVAIAPDDPGAILSWNTTQMPLIGLTFKEL